MINVIYPYSYIDSNYSEFEFLIQWSGRNGSLNYWMFYDAEYRQQIKNNVVNEDSESTINSIVNQISRSITLKATNLTKNEYEALMQIAENTFVYRIKKDNTRERFAPSPQTFKYVQSGNRYEIEIELIRSEIKPWK